MLEIFIEIRSFYVKELKKLETMPVGEWFEKHFETFETLENHIEFLLKSILDIDELLEDILKELEKEIEKEIEEIENGTED